MRITTLAGGTGAARFLRGLVRAVDPSAVTVVANTGDDLVLHGLHVSPDLDTVTYTLGGGIHPDQGWGRAGESFTVAGELRDRYGRSDWFALGDRDLATHLVRTELLHGGATLTEATATIAAAWQVGVTLLPMTDQPVATRVRTTDGRMLHFQEWWVRERAAPAVQAVWLDGAEDARPAPGVLEAIETADAVLLCPSNPVVSIGTILAVEGIRKALRRVPVAGVSPIVGGSVVRGMADRLLPAVGVAVAADAVARWYASGPEGFLDAWVLDRADADLAEGLRRDGLRVAVTDTVFTSPQVAETVARTALDLLGVGR